MRNGAALAVDASSVAGFARKDLVMNKSNGIVVIVCILFLGAALGPMAWVRAGSVPTRPNIILIMADDLGYGDLSCYSSKTIETPHLDALAREGLSFQDYHANGPVCSPTRAALMTGRYQQRSQHEGVIFANGPSRETGLALSEITVAEVLQAAGYRTAAIGKWHLGYHVEFNPVRHGFDLFRGYVSGNVDYHSHIDGAGIEDWWRNEQKEPDAGYVTDLLSDYAVQFIEENKGNPFFLYVAHEAPHFPYQGRNDKAGRTPGHPHPQLGHRLDRQGAYREMIEAMDEGIGRLIKTVRESGLEQQTLILFCSDNGATQEGSNGVLRGFKGSLWEGGHRVPAIAWWPGRIPPGTVSAETVLSMDLFPTLAAIAVAEVPGDLNLDGLDISPVLFEGRPLPERWLFWRYRSQKAARRGQWKLLISRQKKTEQADVYLFDLTRDRAEQHNLASQEPDRVRRMRHRLEAWEKTLPQQYDEILQTKQ